MSLPRKPATPARAFYLRVAGENAASLRLTVHEPAVLAEVSGSICRRVRHSGRQVQHNGLRSLCCG